MGSVWLNEGLLLKENVNEASRDNCFAQVDPPALVDVLTMEETYASLSADDRAQMNELRAKYTGTGVQVQQQQLMWVLHQMNLPSN